MFVQRDYLLIKNIFRLLLIKLPFKTTCVENIVYFFAWDPNPIALSRANCKNMLDLHSGSHSWRPFKRAIDDRMNCLDGARAHCDGIVSVNSARSLQAACIQSIHVRFPALNTLARTSHKRTHTFS